MNSARFQFGRAVRLIFSFLIASLPSYAQSTAETAEAIQRELDALKVEFIANLHAAISNPENLQSGQTKIGCEQILARLEQIMFRIDETIDLLAKRENALADQVDFTDAEREDFKKILKSQKLGLASMKYSIKHLMKELRALMDREIDEISKVYNYALDISGQEQAHSKLESRVNAILNRELSPNPNNEIGTDMTSTSAISSESDSRLSTTIPSSEVWQAFYIFLQEVESSLCTKKLAPEVSNNIREIMLASQKSHELKQTPNHRIRIFNILNNIHKIIDECGVRLKQKANLSQYKKTMQDTEQSFEIRYRTLALNADRNVEAIFASSALKIQKMRDEWYYYTLNKNDFFFSRHDPFVSLLLSKANSEMPHKNTNYLD